MPTAKRRAGSSKRNWNSALRSGEKRLNADAKRGGILGAAARSQKARMRKAKAKKSSGSSGG